MFTGDADLESLTAGATVIAEGLGLWPEALVDQHFLKRQRDNRLISAVIDRPTLVGVGIDEGTAVIVQDAIVRRDRQERRGRRSTRAALRKVGQTPRPGAASSCRHAA